MLISIIVAMTPERLIGAAGRLPWRRNLGVSRNADPPVVAGVEWFKSLDAAIDFARQTGESECFIAGGTEIYAEAIEKSNRMYVTYVQRDFPFQGDTYFP